MKSQDRKLGRINEEKEEWKDMKLKNLLFNQKWQGLCPRDLKKTSNKIEDLLILQKDPELDTLTQNQNWPLDEIQ